MSTCISHYGEFGHHEPEVDSFTCVRCGAEDWDEVMAHIARLSERLDLAVTMHGVQLERANRVTAERDTQHAAAALLAETLVFRTAERDALAEKIDEIKALLDQHPASDPAYHAACQSDYACDDCDWFERLCASLDDRA